ncbi:hypothetical protein VNO78_10601 [Psophocarpus tetragonolobus]|uniref:RRM domain-containing protein n=1 Tax=Psophocarpus tetragonolobus TaxID=3891 RepID=A0AAN9SK22_PSOTE
MVGDLWKVFQHEGRVWDVFVAQRWGVKGHRYGFVRFLDVHDASELEKRSDGVKDVGRGKLSYAPITVLGDDFSEEGDGHNYHEEKEYVVIEHGDTSTREHRFKFWTLMRIWGMGSMPQWIVRGLREDTGIMARLVEGASIKEGGADNKLENEIRLNMKGEIHCAQTQPSCNMHDQSKKGTNSGNCVIGVDMVVPTPVAAMCIMQVSPPMTLDANGIATSTAPTDSNMNVQHCPKGHVPLSLFPSSLCPSVIDALLPKVILSCRGFGNQQATSVFNHSIAAEIASRAPRSRRRSRLARPNRGGDRVSVDRPDRVAAEIVSTAASAALRRVSTAQIPSDLGASALINRAARSSGSSSRFRRPFHRFSTEFSSQIQTDLGVSAPPGLPAPPPSRAGLPSALVRRRSSREGENTVGAGSAQEPFPVSSKPSPPKPSLSPF